MAIGTTARNFSNFGSAASKRIEVCARPEPHGEVEARPGRLLPRPNTARKAALNPRG